MCSKPDSSRRAHDGERELDKRDNYNKLTLGAVWQYLVPDVEFHSFLAVFLLFFAPLGFDLLVDNILNKHKATYVELFT